MPEKMTDDEIKGKILLKLTNKGKFVHSHTSVDNVPKSFPGHMGGSVKTCVKELFRENILIRKPTSYGLQISLNLVETEKIKEYISIFEDSVNM